MWGLRFRVQRSVGSGFKVQGSGFWVLGSGFWVMGSRLRVQGLGFRVQDSAFRVQGSGFRVQGLWCPALYLAEPRRLPDIGARKASVKPSFSIKLSGRSLITLHPLQFSATVTTEATISN